MRDAHRGTETEIEIERLGSSRSQLSQGFLNLYTIAQVTISYASSWLLKDKEHTFEVSFFQNVFQISSIQLFIWKVLQPFKI